MKTLLLAGLLLMSCAETRIYRKGQLACAIQGDAANITFRSGDVYFHADRLSHSAATSAAYTGATSLVGGIGAAVVSGLAVKP